MEMQESVEVYERLGLKAEYLYAYRMLIFLMLQAGDFNALSRELVKFTGENNSDEGVRVVLTKLWNGESLIDQREKGVIIRCGDGLVGCGLDKVRVFQQCVVPPLREFYSTNKNERVLQAEIIDKLVATLNVNTMQPE